VAAAVLSVVVLLASGTLWGLYRKFSGQITHLGGGAIPTQNHDVDGNDQNILLVGNDSRGGLTNGQLAEVGTQANAGVNTDSILLVHIPANGRKATVVSFPRDSYVTIPGFRSNKINAAYADGACENGCGNTLTPAQRTAGTGELVKTVSLLTGLHIDHYVEVGLLGFYQISKVLGGVEVCLKAPAKDHFSGIDLPAGKQKIEGTQALAFVRQRHGIPGGDLGRIKRQQAFLGAVAHQILSADTLLNPIKLNQLLDAVSKSLTTDDKLDPLQLAGQLRDIAAGNVIFKTVPIANAAGYVPGAGDVVLLDKAKLPGFFASIVGGKSGGSSKTSTKTVPRAQVSVQVLNASDANGLAGRTKTALAGMGFKVSGTGNAASSQQTVIRYSSSQAAAAHTLAKVVPGAQLTQDDSLGSSVNLVLGSSFSGLQSGSGSSGSGSSGSGSSSSQPPPRTAADNSCVY
jgi:LCP family protein required for cell wall assembly